MDGQFLGQILALGFNFAPKGWQTCSGQLIAINQNQALFAILGTTYGGNGIQTFALPDLRGRAPIHWGAGPGLQQVVLGEVQGAEKTTMAGSNLPAHNHFFNTNNQVSSLGPPSGNYLAQGPVVSGANTSIYGSPASVGVAMASNAIANAGGNLPFNVLQPYNVVNYCVALTGIFPSRN